MYIDDASDGGELKVTVSGEEYTAEVNYDYNHDGLDDSVVVDTDDGEIAYIDTDGDGMADQLDTYDEEHGLQHAHFDPTTGEWVSGEADSANDSGDHPRGDAGAPDSLTVDESDGGVTVEHLTVDSDGDGSLDTAMVETGHGSVLYTDVDGDGSADKMTEISDTGEIEVREHTGEHEWTVTEQTGLDGSDSAQRDFSAEDDSMWSELFSSGDRDDVVRIDTATGQWISPN